MKKILFLTIATLSLFACSKEVEMERASYTWVEGDSIPKRSFIMSVATFSKADSLSERYKLDCQVTLGDSTDKNLIGSRMDLNVLFDNGNNGRFSIGNNCNGTITYRKCRPGTTTNVEFFQTDYTLTEGNIDLKNESSSEVLLDVNLRGEAKVSFLEAVQDTILTESGEIAIETRKDTVISETGDTTLVPVTIEKFETKEIRIKGEITARK